MAGSVVGAGCAAAGSAAGAVCADDPAAICAAVVCAWIALCEDGAVVPPVSLLPQIASSSAFDGPPMPPWPAGRAAVVAGADWPWTVLAPVRYGAGSVALPSSRTSKCTCGPVQLPVQPTSPIFWPALT